METVTFNIQYFTIYAILIQCSIVLIIIIIQLIESCDIFSYTLLADYGRKYKKEMNTSSQTVANSPAQG